MKGSCSQISVVLTALALVLAFFPVETHGQTAAPPAVAQQTAGPVLVARIANNLNSKNAKVGDVLTAKTLKPLKLSDGTDLPKGSKLVAKVTAVQSKQAGNGTSMLTFRFDQAEVKGGSPLSIQGVFVPLGPRLGPKMVFGQNWVLGGGGVGSTVGLDPNAGLGKAAARDEDDIPLGSTLEAVGLGRHLDADWTTALQGIRRDIQLDGDVLIKVEFK